MRYFIKYYDPKCGRWILSEDANTYNYDNELGEEDINKAHLFCESLAMRPASQALGYFYAVVEDK